MYFREENKPAAGGNFLEFSSDLHFGNAFSVKGFESSRDPNPQKFSPAADFSPRTWGGKNFLSPPRGPDPGGVKILGFSFPPP